MQGRTWWPSATRRAPRAGGRARARLLERADNFDGVPCSYQVAPERLHLYADFGLAFVKLGEEATVSLERFSLEGRDSKGFRNALSRLERAGARFRVVPREEVPPLLPELHRVSDEWLAGRGTAEKGFSLGSFDERYLARFPAAVVERDGRIEAFANVWPGADGRELSSDLMRHRDDAPTVRWRRSSSFDALGRSEATAVQPGMRRSPASTLRRSHHGGTARPSSTSAGRPFTTSRPARLQGQVSPAGSLVPAWPAPGSAAGPGRYLRADRRGLPEDVPQMMKTAPTLVATFLTVAAASMATPSPAADETDFTFGAAGRVAVYTPSGPPASVVLFVSGDGGWNQGVVPMAERLRDLGALVVGIDIRTFVRNLEASSARCAYPAGDLEELSRAVQVRWKLPSYLPPILVGYSSGATLVYAALVSAPAETFAGALSLGFCPDLEIHKPLCRGRALQSRPRKKAVGFDLEADRTLAVPWYVFQGDIDQVCDAGATRAYAARVPTAPGGLPKVGHGFSVPELAAQLVEAYRRPATREEPALSPAGQPLDLPLVECRRPRSWHDLMAVIISGDGGWAALDKSLAQVRCPRHPCRGLEQPALLLVAAHARWRSRDLDRALRHYSRLGKKRVLLVGYSFGPTSCPSWRAVCPPIPGPCRGVGLLGLDTLAAFEFHVTDWLGAGGDRRYPTVPRSAARGNPRCCVGSGRARLRLPFAAAVVRWSRYRGAPLRGDYARLGTELLAAVADRSERRHIILAAAALAFAVAGAEPEMANSPFGARLSTSISTGSAAHRRSCS